MRLVGFWDGALPGGNIGISHAMSSPGHLRLQKKITAHSRDARSPLDCRVGAVPAMGSPRSGSCEVKGPDCSSAKGWGGVLKKPHDGGNLTAATRIP